MRPSWIRLPPAGAGLTVRGVDSGHGGQVKDRNGDEKDGYDEVIFPLDYQRAGYIVDDVSVSEPCSRASCSRFI